MNIPLNIDIVQILLHMLNFVILAGGLTLLLFKPVNRFMEQRREHFETLARQNTEQAAENAKQKAEYEAKLAQADALLSEKRKQAEREMAEAAQDCMAQAKEKAALLIAAAEKDAEEQKEHILSSAQTEIGELVLSATQKLLSDTVTPERNQALYDEFIRLADQTVEAQRTSE